MLGGESYAVRLTTLLTIIMWGKLGVAQRTSFASQQAVNEKCEECPSYCDETGAEHEPVNCRIATTLSFCCNYGARLDCCTNETLKITTDISDGFHCPSLGTFNRTVLSVCVPVGFVCFVMAIALFIYQKVRRRRGRQRRSSNNSHFDRRSTSNASCSSRSSRSSIGSRHHPPHRRESVSNISSIHQQQQQHQQQQATVVLSPSSLEDNIRINDDVVLRVLQTVNAVPPGRSATSSAAETCFIIQSTVYPPPYTDERPPSYTDIFPSYNDIFPS